MTGAGSTSARLAATLALALALLVHPGALDAQQPDTPDAVAAQQPDSLATITDGTSNPSPAVAGVLSLATTAGPFALGAALGDELGLGLIGAGVLFGPLSGYAYGDVMDRGVKGLAFRSAVAAGGTLAILALCQTGECNPFRDNPPEGDNVSGITLGIVIVGGIVLVGSAAIDVLSAPDHVTRANEARAEERAREASARVRPPPGMELSVYPLLAADGPAPGVGVGASLSF